MELVINEKTYTLKKLNAERRVFLLNYILPYYDIKNKTDKDTLTFYNNLKSAIWIFLKDEDKKEIGIIDNLEVDEKEYGNFINFFSQKITEYCNYVKLQSNQEGTKTEKIESIYAYLSSIYGWTFDYIKEMDELELLKALKEAIKIQERKQVQDINKGALIGAFSSGSKKAKSEIDKINRKINLDERREMLKNSEIKTPDVILTDEQMRSL